MEKHPAGNTDKTVGIGKRFVALFLDGLLIAVALFGVTFLGTFVLGVGGGSAAGSAASGGAFAALGAVYLATPFLVFGYYIVMEAVYGYTLGKKAMGLVVVSDDGSSISWVESIIRNVLRVVDGFFAYLVGAIVIALTDDRQRVGDLAGSTLVVEQA